MPLPNRTHSAGAAAPPGPWPARRRRRRFMLYALLALLFLLAAACGGNARIGQSPTPPATPRLILTPPLPPTLAPLTPPTPTPTPTRPPTATPATLPPTPSPTPTPTSELPTVAANQRIPYVQVTAGKNHACALQADGVAHCWGDDHFGKTYVPARMRFRQISAGLHFTCGLLYAGAIACWGDNSKGQTDAPPGSFTHLAAGGRHACALDTAGKPVCWGRIAAAPATDFAYQAISSGFNYTCGLTIAGDLKCWGFRIAARPGPFTALAAGLHHICLLQPNAAAVCYGDNVRHQGDTPETAFAAIAAGWHHSCGITRADGALECWGAGAPGRPRQRLAAPAGVFTALSSGWQNNCALRPDGAAQCWPQPNPDPALRHSANLTAAFNGRVFDLPVALFPWPAGGLAVVERAGAIRAYDNDNANANANAAGANANDSHRNSARNGAGANAGRAPRLILDLTGQVDTFGERGMVSAALDPDFDQFPFLYVYYHLHAGADNRSVGRLSRFPVVHGVAQRAAELVILTLPDLGPVHLGGAIRFGPDDTLYLGLGDNANSKHAQNLASRHGKIIRIDVRGATAAQPYRIPDDNPFATTPGALPEIWAYGLRNPWRMDFDADHNLWVADVGDLSEEEVSIATAGANLGWPFFEGNRCLSSAENCAALQATTTAPVIAYTHQEGKAIIGGPASPQPGIAYIFGDYASRRIYTLTRAPDTPAGWRRQQIARANGSILAFGRDAAGQVFVLVANQPILQLEW